jgi:hypothetical protein
MVLFILAVQVRVLEKFKEIMFLENTLTMFSNSTLKLLLPPFRGHGGFLLYF